MNAIIMQVAPSLLFAIPQCSFSGRVLHDRKSPFDLRLILLYFLGLSLGLLLICLLLLSGGLGVFCLRGWGTFLYLRYRFGSQCIGFSLLGRLYWCLLRCFRWFFFFFFFFFFRTRLLRRITGWRDWLHDGGLLFRFRLRIVKSDMCFRSLLGQTFRPFKVNLVISSLLSISGSFCQLNDEAYQSRLNKSPCSVLV